MVNMKKKDNTIECSFQELDKIIEQMSDEKCSIEKSLELYEKGIKIINEVDKKIEKMRANDTLQKLEKGFLYTTNKNNKRINSVKQVKDGDIIKIYLVDGSIDSKVININKESFN